MNRLIRAEWFRVRKTYHLFFWCMALFLLFTFVSFTSLDLDNASKAIKLFSEFIEPMTLTITYGAMVVAGMYVSSYENKMLKYEIMIGESPVKIILSKIITAVPLLLVASLVPVVAPLIYFGNKNGYGDTTYLASNLIFIALISLRALVSSILIMTTFKSLMGMFVAFVRFLVFEGIYVVVLSLVIDLTNMSNTLGKILASLSIMWNYYYATGEKIPKDAFTYSIVACVVEILIWFVLSYNSYKKKWFD